MPRVMSMLLTDLATIPRHDRVRALLLFLYVFCNASGYVISRTVADSMFLSRIGTERLPAAYMVSAGAVSLGSILYGWLIARQSLRLVIRWTLALFAVVSCVFPTLMQQAPRSLLVFAGVYVFVQVRGAIGTAQFTTLLNEQFVGRNPERIFGIVGLGATLAGALTGLLLWWLSRNMATASFLYIAAGIDLLAIVPIATLRSHTALPIPQPEVPDQRHGGGSAAIYIAGLVCLAALVSTLVEFQWKVAAAEELARDEMQLTNYFGWFYALAFLLTAVAQLFLTGQVLHHRGVLPALLAFPLAILLATVGSLLSSGQRMFFWALTLAKGCDVFKRSLNDPGLQMLYMPMPTQLRRRSVALAFGMVKPMSEALVAALILIAVPLISVRQLSLLVLGLTVTWLVLVIAGGPRPAESESNRTA